MSRFYGSLCTFLLPLNKIPARCKIHFASKSYSVTAWHSSSGRQPSFAAFFKEWNYGTFAPPRVTITLDICPHSSFLNYCRRMRRHVVYFFVGHVCRSRFQRSQRSSTADNSQTCCQKGTKFGKLLVWALLYIIADSGEL